MESLKFNNFAIKIKRLVYFFFWFVSPLIHDNRHHRSTTDTTTTTTTSFHDQNLLDFLSGKNLSPQPKPALGGLRCSNISTQGL